MGGRSSTASKGADGAEKNGSSREAQNLALSKPWEEVMKNGLGVTKKKGSSYFDVHEALSDDSDMSSESIKPSEPTRVYFACTVQGFRKDQDRFVCIPQLLDSPSVLFCGIFDGHGRDGDIVAESVAVFLPQTLREELGKRIQTSSSTSGNTSRSQSISTKSVHEAIETAFEITQKSLDSQYEEEVVIPTMKLKKEIEEQQKTDLGRVSLPLGSGTTATIMLISERLLYVANVGDSRAILCRKHPSNADQLVVEDLTKDQNVIASDDAEKERIEDAGGTIFNRHVAGDFVDGMLQLTRSLGDVPLHRQNIVLHKPEIKSIPVDASMMFVLTASDGLWDNFTSEDAAKFVKESVVKHTSGAENSLESETLRDIFTTVSEELENEAAARASKAGRQSDDISVFILSVSRWWGEANQS
mmetsp:Transcript_12719/g.24676  ORF Transcript_12719/g.24676 Transcript_12719/m.24676 type:complete len:415 (+) Transcript_12719:97-1341(+)